MPLIPRYILASEKKQMYWQAKWPYAFLFITITDNKLIWQSEIHIIMNIPLTELERTAKIAESETIIMNGQQAENGMLKKLQST